MRPYATYSVPELLGLRSSNSRSGPHMMLEDRRPIDVVISSELGRPLVEDILGWLKYGTGA